MTASRLAVFFLGEVMRELRMLGLEVIPQIVFHGVGRGLGAIADAQF